MGIDYAKMDRASAARLKRFIGEAHQANIAAGGLKYSSEPQFCLYCSQLLEQFANAPYCSSQCAINATEDK